MSITVYGIPNCETVKKARAWLDAHAVAYTFHDYKKAGADPARLGTWADAVGWEAVINRAGMTFRKLANADKTDLDRARAVALMVAQPSMIRRPIVERDGAVVLIGFKMAEWEAVLG